MPFGAALEDHSPPITAGQRKSARARLDLPARLVTFTGTVACTLVDVSCTGAKISAPEPPRVGAMVVVEGAPMELFGTVQWKGTRSFGIRFDKPFSQETIIGFRHHADGAAERMRREQLSFASDWVQGRV